MKNPGQTGLFVGGTIWMGPGQQDESALLVVDGRIAAIGEAAIQEAAGFESDDRAIVCETIDLEGGFLMPSFGEGHAHPLFTAAYVAGAAGSSLTSQASVSRILYAMGRVGGVAPGVGDRPRPVGRDDQFRRIVRVFRGEPLGDQVLLLRTETARRP